MLPYKKIPIYLYGYGWKMNFVYPVGTGVLDGPFCESKPYVDGRSKPLPYG